MTVRVRDGLRQEVLKANLAIPQVGLATLTWGNVSGVDREAGVFVIKPSGVPYEDLALDHLVTVRLSDGKVVDGDLRPSTDTETHRCLYLAFPSIGGVTHTHSTHAVAFAQAHRDVPVLGTTHADTFNGPIPVTRDLTAEECASDYEYNTGRVIVDLLKEDDRRATEVPAALVAGHGPFTWGTSARKSLEHAIICEAVADIALHTLSLSPAAPPPPHLLNRHYTRKHGPGAYYGNPEATTASG
ncbi:MULTISPECIES: L-ribulose-5-phosphate 4-epimerase AraD [unclassified Streptomyces]|uniref:L-ribulose-5-phosphate 4-epimerase AraD n=1 Tax=unclassified Streptomyces TaxID=2593676 RepID=UPI002475F3CA|nr:MULTISPECIES: L-ribulose-5-phosphate 4-epimerase AraD [unclassified Streptomyces]MDH6449522.1 L-ribulose-5-phosphate 4-epimerase [Streptomyces sp. SAI-119]MDH6499896.1 L-ribulose-5-phosphate 4-epimerase [Streptomyces sp. SAI-149]